MANFLSDLGRTLLIYVQRPVPECNSRRGSGSEVEDLGRRAVLATRTTSLRDHIET